MIHVDRFRPGDPGFEEAAARVTPLRDIRKGFSQSSNNLTADLSPVTSRRRNESPNKARG
jgi:hypothetical protein